MSRVVKIIPARGLLRKPTAASARNFPAWVDSETRAVPLTAVVEPRVRDSLVLRIVAKGKTVHAKGPSDVRRAR